VLKNQSTFGKVLPKTRVGPLTSTWPHLRRDVGLEKGEYWKKNCLCATNCVLL